MSQVPVIPRVGAGGTAVRGVAEINATLTPITRDVKKKV